MPQIMLAGVIAPINSNFKVLLSYFTLGRWGTEGFAHIQDSAAESAEKFTAAGNMPASVMRPLPGPTGEIQMQPYGAMEQLGFYPDNSSLVSLFPQSLLGVNLALMLLSLAFFVAIYIALKVKDSRFV